MIIQGMTWKSHESPFWLAEVHLLDLMTQAERKDEIPMLIKEAIELLVDDPDFHMEVTLMDTVLYLEPNAPKKLVGLILKRQRSKSRLTLEEVATNLKAKSINEYAQSRASICPVLKN